jgi:hypothetical protein
VLAALAAAVDGWVPAADAGELVRVLGLVDRLVAKCHGVVGELDVDGVWELDGATSMAAWLQLHAGQTGAQATSMARTARRLRSWPATAEAWEGGALSGGHVRAISANVVDEAVPLFGEQEHELVAALSPLSVAHAARLMRGWAARAEAVLEDRGLGPGCGRARSRLHLSKLLDGRHRLDGDLDVEAGELLATALRLAESPDVAGEPRRTAAERRADALADLCRRFLDHDLPGTDPGDSPASGRRRRGRSRPHLNVLCDLGDLGGGHARLIDGTPLGRATTQRLLCDAGVHRVVTDGRSTIVDVGATTRTIPNGLFQALVIRDRGCRFPGCERPPEWTEAHHVVPWPQGGPTELGNLLLLCARHHHLVHGQHGHRAGWQLALFPDGLVAVTSPEGRVARGRPPP